MKTNKLAKTLSLIVFYSFEGKVLSMLARLLMTKTVGLEAMGLYSLVNPLMILLINLAQLGIPLAIATIIAARPKDAQKIFFSGLTIGLSISIFLMIVLYFLAPSLATNFFKSENLLPSIYAIGFLLPLIVFSSLSKGYYIGIGRVEQTLLSTVSEEVVRLTFILFFLKYFSNISPTYGALGAVIGVILGEIAQTAYLFLIAPWVTKKRVVKIITQGISLPKQNYKDIFKVAIPVTLGRLIGSLAYFIEPLIFSFELRGMGMEMAQITRLYASLEAYALPLLLMPSFIINALATYLLPQMIREIEKNQIKEAYSIFKKVLIFAFFIGLSMALIFFFFANNLTRLFYGSKEGANLVKLLAFPFIIFYLEAPIINALSAIKKGQQALIATIISSAVRILLVIFLSDYLNIYALVIALIASSFIDVLYNYLIIHNYFKNNLNS